MAVRLLGVVFRQSEVERRERRHRAGHAHRLNRLELRQHASHVGANRLNVLAVALRQPDAADLEARAHVRSDDLNLGRTTADVDDERAGSQVADPAERHRRLLVAREEPRREAVAPLDLAQEGLAVLGITDGARRDRERPFRAERLELAAVVREDVADARDRERQELAARVDSFAEARDREPTHDLRQFAVHVRDEQSTRVRPEIDRGDPHLLRGRNDAIRSTEARTSAIAAVETASSARDARRRVSDASSALPLVAAVWR